MVHFKFRSDNLRVFIKLGGVEVEGTIYYFMSVLVLCHGCSVYNPVRLHYMMKLCPI